MQALLFPLIVWVLGSAIARVLLGAGLAIGSYITLEPLMQQFISVVLSSLGGLAPEMGAILWIAGAGEALTAILSALVARMSIQSAMIFVGKASA